MTLWWRAILSRLGLIRDHPPLRYSPEAERIIVTMHERARALADADPDWAEIHARTIAAERRLRALRAERADGERRGD